MINFASIKVQKVYNGYIITPGTGKQIVVEGHATKKLAEALATLFNAEEE